MNTSKKQRQRVKRTPPCRSSPHLAQVSSARFRSGPTKRAPPTETGQMSFVRPATHAAPHGRGWYEAIPERLKKTLDDYFSEATHHYDTESPLFSRMTALIVPHAGMAYSGRTASEAFAVFREYLYGNNTKGSSVERVFLLGPSHTKGFEGCEFSAASAYETPFGLLKVDEAVVKDVMTALRNAGVVTNFASRRTDEAEHSLEMETPYLAHVLFYPPTTSTLSTNGDTSSTPAASRVSIVPFIVGWTDRKDEQNMYAALKPYMDDARNIFIFSSDFCHWGERFSYTYHYQPEQYPQIGDAIVAMDHAAMDLLERRDLEKWYKYLKVTENTICGRAPISVGMQRWANSTHKSQVQFVHYSQSNKCQDTSDSSVSYAAAIIME